MYCPKCGTENAEANKFCRACRENLKVISQAMKRRLPVVLASKLDQMLDSRSERLIIVRVTREQQVRRILNHLDAGGSTDVLSEMRSTQ